MTYQGRFFGHTVDALIQQGTLYIQCLQRAPTSIYSAGIATVVLVLLGNLYIHQFCWACDPQLQFLPQKVSDLTSILGAKVYFFITIENLGGFRHHLGRPIELDPLFQSFLNLVFFKKRGTRSFTDILVPLFQKHSQAPRGLRWPV